MEEIAWLFNTDFEKKLFEAKFDHFESSKQNQEFEYFIHLLNPNDIIFTTKKYNTDYIQYIEKITQKTFFTTSSAKKIKNWCQSFKDIASLEKLQDKVKTQQFASDNNLITHSSKRISDILDLEENFLYRTKNGFSGSGHLSYPEDQAKILKYLKTHGEIIKEERLERYLDFSSLFERNKLLIQYENYIDERFQYKGSYFKKSFALTNEQKVIMTRMFSLLKPYVGNYEGPFSVDSFVYDGGIQPICEINARKTMGYVAYQIWKLYFSQYEEFKFLLFKNKEEISYLDAIKLQSDGVYLLSPNNNNFLIFGLVANETSEMKEVEKKLISALF